MAFHANNNTRAPAISISLYVVDGVNALCAFKEGCIHHIQLGEKSGVWWSPSRVAGRRLSPDDQLPPSIPKSSGFSVDRPIHVHSSSLLPYIDLFCDVYRR
jgi:hypothetical protein